MVQNETTEREDGPNEYEIHNKAEDALEGIDPYNLLTDKKYAVFVGELTVPMKQVTEPLPKYNALYVQDRLVEEIGHLGTSITIKEVSDEN